MKTYTIELPQDLSDYIKERVASGEFSSESEVVCHSIRYMEAFKKRHNISPDAEVITEEYLSRNPEYVLNACQNRKFCILRDEKPFVYMMPSEELDRLEACEKEVMENQKVDREKLKKLMRSPSIFEDLIFEICRAP